MSRVRVKKFFPYHRYGFIADVDCVGILKFVAVELRRSVIAYAGESGEFVVGGLTINNPLGGYLCPCYLFAVGAFHQEIPTFLPENSFVLLPKYSR